jgi:hypothetical protein
MAHDEDCAESAAYQQHRGGFGDDGDSSKCWGSKAEKGNSRGQKISSTAFHKTSWIFRTQISWRSSE